MVCHGRGRSQMSFTQLACVWTDVTKEPEIVSIVGETWNHKANFRTEWKHLIRPPRFNMAPETLGGKTTFCSGW